MASTYGNRISELRDLLAQVPAAANDQINQNFADLVDRYAELRQSAMSDLVDFMAKASAGNLGTQSKWQSRIAHLRTDYQDLFRRAANDVMLPPAHQLFWATALDAEERFFDTLSRVVTPQRMDDLLQHQDNFSKLFGALQDSWTFLLSENDRAKTDQMRIVEDLDKMVQDILSQMDDYWTKTKEYYEKVSDAIAREIDYLTTALKEMAGRAYDAIVAMVELVKAYFIDQNVKPEGTPPEIDPPVIAVLQQMKLAADAAAEGARKYREMIKSYQDLVIRQKGGILTMFNKTRQDVDQYLRSNGIYQAQTYLDQARADLNNWVSNLPTGRQRDDGAVFRDDVNQKLDIVFKRTKDLDDQFKAKFQGALLSPLSNETIETLAQHYLFNEQFSKIKDRELPDKLKDIQEELPEQVIKIDDKLREMVDKVSSTDGLPDEVRNVVREMTEGFRGYLRDRIKNQIDSLLPIIDELKRLMIPSNLDQDLNRQELESMLN